MYHFWSNRKLTVPLGLVLAGAIPLVALAAGPGGGGMGGPGAMGDMAEIGESQITVSTTAPQVGDLSVTTQYIGKIQPETTVSVYPEVSGKVTAVYVSPGETVSKGDLLFEIDPSDLEEQLETAQAQYDSTVAQINQTLGSSLTKSILQAENSLETSERSYSTAKDNLDELEDLEDDYKGDYDDAKEDYEDARDALEDYVAGYEMPDVTLTERYTQYQEALEEAQAALEAAGEEGDPDGSLQAAVTAAQEALDQYVADYNSTYAVENTTEYARLEAAYERAKSAYDSADATYEQFLMTYDATYENYRTEKANAGYTYSYNQELYDIATGEALEETQAIAEAQLKSAALSLQNAQEALADCQVVSPIDGVVESCLVEEYDMANTGSAALTIANKSAMAVSFNVSADGAATLQPGDSVTVSKGENSYTATITQVSSRADDQSGLFPVTAALDDQSAGTLSGVSVKVTATTQSAQGVLLVPNDAVYYEDDVAYVYVYENGAARRVEFIAGLSNAQWVEATEGLRGDERIITTWHPDLKDGAAVTLQEGDEAAEAAETAESGESGDGAAPAQTDALPPEDAPQDGSAPEEVPDPGEAGAAFVPEEGAPQPDAPGQEG